MDTGMTQDQVYSNHWTAGEGYVLHKGDTYAKEIWLGVRDSIETWEEIPEEEIPEDPL